MYQSIIPESKTLEMKLWLHFLGACMQAILCSSLDTGEGVRVRELRPHIAGACRLYFLGGRSWNTLDTSLDPPGTALTRKHIETC